ncbi:MAG: DMT family transporter [Acidobacteria bacterium]|nr:DMT family transporter [Acidobacteriota bacterium]
MGEFFALLTALIWSAAVILIKRSGETMSPFALNFFRVVTSLCLFVPTLFLFGETPWQRAPLSDYLTLFASGVIAIFVSDTLFHHSLNIVGAGLSAIVDCLYAPLTVLAAWVLLGERLGPLQLVGLALVTGGVVCAAGHEPPRGVPAKRLVAGVVWGVAAMVMLAIGITIAKPVLNKPGTSVMWATTVRQIGCLLVMVPAALLSPRRRSYFRVFRPSPAWKHSIPGAILGSYLALMCWIAGMKYAKVGVAAILNQSSTIYILVFAALFLKEKFTLRKAVACAVALAGLVLVTVA